MPEIPFARVVSVSSADPRHPAENLLRPDDGGRWRGAAAGEKQLSVVLELANPEPIHSLHIGNDGAAFVEVLVGSSSGGDFQVLLPSAALMSPAESRSGAEPRRVRFFGAGALVPGAARARCDRLKVVLSQPYCQLRPFGLSFIRVFGAAEDEEEKKGKEPRRLGPFRLREEGEGEGEGSSGPAPGSLFYRRPSPAQAPAPPPPGPSYAAAALGDRDRDSGLPPKRRLPSPKPSPPPPKKPPRALPSPPAAGVPPKPGGPVLGGVVLALSGFQNPLRARLREAALGLGAAYSGDWSAECTHLVCAFPRTPKARRARLQGGVVVGAAWIWECQRRGRRLDCGPFLLRDSASDSDEPEDAPPPPPPRPSPKARKGAGPKRPATPPATPPESPESDGQSERSDPFSGSTEENSEDEEGEGQEEPIPPLPDFFRDHFFLLLGDFRPGEERRLRRWAVAFGGTVAPFMDDSVTHVVTSQDWGSAFQEALELRPSLTFVRPDWLLLCGERQRPLPAAPFAVGPPA